MCQGLLTWKEAMEEKGLRVNIGKMKIMICGTGLDLLHSSGEFPCAVCGIGVGSNSIFCNGCKHWVHKKCSGLKRLTKDLDYRCTQCQGTARPLEADHRGVQIGPDKLEVVASFCYLGHMLTAASACKLPTTTCENRLEEVVTCHKLIYVIWLLKFEIYSKYCGKEKKLLLRNKISSFPQHFVTCC